MQPSHETTMRSIGMDEPTTEKNQSDSTATSNSGLTCLVLIARLHDIAAEPAQLLHDFGEVDGCFTTASILHAAKKLGLSAECKRAQLDRLDKLALPAICCGTNGEFFILGRIEKNDEATRLLIHEQHQPQPRWIDIPTFIQLCANELILFASRTSIAGELTRFDFSWFIPAIVKYRHLLSEVLLVSIVLQLFGLVTPLFFQVVMDKVLVHRGFNTLDVIAIGLLIASIFEVTLSGLRSYIFSHTCCRIDVELGARLFKHLLALPLPWFQARRAGDSVARMRELEQIRSFLTGNGITLVLDLLFSVIFLAVMLIYSVQLTLIVFFSLPCYLLLSIIATPILRSRLDEQFKRGAENQAFLFETVTSIDTVKSMAVESRWTKKWENQLAAYIQAAFKASTTGNIASCGVAVIGKIVTVLTMWLGAKLVIDGELSVGQLIAFNMLASHVAMPVMRLAQMWSDFQQVGVSVTRLGEILNADRESSQHGLAIPTIKGHIHFEQVSFRYRSEGNNTLSDINLQIQAGEVIGIVGRSGSGKSTLTRLLQRLHIAQQGRILVDGIDLAVIDPASLRRQIGVVLQESQLFNGSIRENIALADPGAALEKIIHIAKLAGAHQFITELSEGYETIIGENGCGLSGGQKQRIAIARALMRDPRILIFDEATSALDYESERLIQLNMAAICKRRTVIIIAHRLTAVRHAHRIIVVEQGRLAEQGRHTDLVNKENGLYSRLFKMQQAS